MKPVGVMFKLTLREAARRKVLWGLIILSVLFLLLYALGLSFIQAEIARFGVRPAASRNGLDLKTGYSFLATFALYAANFLIVLLAVLIPMDTLAHFFAFLAAHQQVDQPASVGWDQFHCLVYMFHSLETF